MSPRTRVLILFIATLAIVGAGFGYTIGRIEKWHDRGWTGLAYSPAMQVSKGRKPKTKAPSALQQKAGDVMMTYGHTASQVVQPNDHVVSVNGIPIEDMQRLRALSEEASKGTPITFRMRRGGRLVDVTIPLESPLRSRFIVVRTLVAFVVAAIYIAVAVIVFRKRPDDRRVIVFYAFALVSSLAILSKAATFFENGGGRGIEPAFGFSAATVLPALFSLLYAPLILHLALIFPRERPIVERHPTLIRWIYAGTLLATLLFLVIIALLLVFFRHAANAERAAYELGYTTAKVVTALSIGGLLLALHVIWAGRREGVIRAFESRPFRAVVAIFAFFLASIATVGRYGSGTVAFFAGLVLVLVPLALLCSYPIIAVVALVRSYRDAGVEEKRQVQWPVWALCITLASKIVTVAIGFFIGIMVQTTSGSALTYRRLFYALDIVPTVVTVLIPFSFAFAILKYRLMNIDVIIRKTVVYTILSGVIVAIYIALVGGLGTLLVRMAGVRNQTLVVVSTLLVAGAFVPLRNKLQTLVDRNLFRHRYDYPAALQAISLAARGATDTNEFLVVAAEKLQQALHNRAVVIFVERQDEYVATAKVGVSDSILGRLRVPRAFASRLGAPFDPRQAALGEEIAGALARVDAALVVPIGTRGFIAVAPKLSGAGIDPEDIDFLRSAADQMAMASDRIRMQVEEADFAQARAIQETLLPREMPRVAKLDLAGIWQPARTMGGDYYDLLELSAHELAVCIGDVAGKGMPAALLMSGLQAAVRASASNSPRDLCERVRRVVVSSLSGGRFVTFFYATLDTAAMRLRWCNAGHNAPILARAGGSIVRLEEGGPAFSRLFRDTPYGEHEIDLAPGDKLVLFTDGVSEATDGGGTLFGEERIEALVAGARELDAHALQRKIVEAALAHGGGEVEDDVTLVVIGVGG